MNTVPPRPKPSDFSESVVREYFKTYPSDAEEILKTVFFDYRSKELNDEQIKCLSLMDFYDPYTLMADMNDESSLGAISEDIFNICEGLWSQLSTMLSKAIDKWGVTHDINSKGLPIGTPVKSSRLDEHGTIIDICKHNHGIYQVVTPSLEEGRCYYMKFEDVTEIVSE